MPHEPLPIDPCSEARGRQYALASWLGLFNPSIINLSSLPRLPNNPSYCLNTIYIVCTALKLMPQELAGGSTALTSNQQILAYCAGWVLGWSEQCVGMLWAQPSPPEAEGATWEAVW